jgi:molybdate transport system substrate-binding protein
VLPALVIVIPVFAAGCGDSAQSSGGDQDEPLVVSAAASLKGALGAYAERFDTAGVRSSFGPSDELAAQIESGVKPDVYAAANTQLPKKLHAQGLVGKPVVFAQNRLVIAVPAGSGRIASVADLAAPGVSIAIGSSSVPIGEYTRKVLARLDQPTRDMILKNVRSEEPDAPSLVGKVSQGAVDATLVYVTDVNGSGGKLAAVDLPEELQPRVSYAAAVVTGAKHPRQAALYIDGLLDGTGRDALTAAGFEPPREDEG